MAVLVGNKVVPKLRFSEFDDAWAESILLENVNKISSGKTKSKSDGLYVVYGSTGVIGRTDDYSHEGDYLLIARVGANAGRINKVIGRFGVTDNTLVVDVKDKLNIDFLYLALFRYNLNRLVFGSGQPLITGGQLKSLKLNIPSLPEQQKIAAFLTAVDDKIQQLTKKKELLEQYKKGVMQQIFPSASSGQVPKLRFKDDKGNDFPEWEEKNYGNIYSFFTTNSLSRDKLNYDISNVRNIHYGDIHTKFNSRFDVIDEYVPFINNDVDLSRIKDECYCQVGDLVIADASEDYDDIGKTIEIKNLNNEKVLAGLHTFLARPNKYKMANGFMTYYVQTWGVRKQVMIIAQGTKVLGLATSRLSKVKLNIPSFEEQQKIASFLSGLDDKTEQVVKQLEGMQQFKKGLLQQMFV